MSQWMKVPTAGICLCVVAALSSLGCDVGRSVLAPLNDASTDMTLPPSDGPTDGATDGSTVDVGAGTRTCSDFVACASSCASGSGFAACITNCARELRPASQPLFDSFATCIRAACDGGIDDGQCAGSMATLTACGAQLRACSADGAPADGGMDVPATDTPATDIPATDTPATDTPATDTPATDGPLTTCSAAFSMGFPRCSGTASFWPCITALRSGLAGAELTRFNALTTCVEAACGPTPNEMCASTHCYQEATNCHPICAFAGSCAVSVCTGADCRAAAMSCGAPLSGAEATHFASLRSCLERVCGAALPSACITSASTETMCASELGACGVRAVPPSDGGVDAGPDVTVMDVPVTDVPVTDAPVTDVPADLPVGALGCLEGVQHCIPSCPERDVDCMRRCASGMRAPSMTLFNNLITCLTGACGSISSYICFQAASEALCSTQINACIADSAGTAPLPACGTPASQAGESRCGGMCVNTSYRNNANCGLCGAACAASETCSFGACVPHGVTNIALQWDGIGDVDLVVRTPCGNVVSGRQTANCGATFDRSNSTGVGPESISFAATPMTGRYIVCAIPRTTIRGTRPGSRVLLDRTGMPLTITPPPMSGTATDRIAGEFTVLPTTPDTTTDDCTATSPFHLADIDL